MTKNMKIKNLKIKIFFILLFSFSLLAFSFDKARAQEATRTFTIVPPTAMHTLDPGGKAEGVMKVINDSNETLTFTATVHDFDVSDTKGTPNFLPDNTLSAKYSAASWMGVTPHTFTIEPHQKQILNYYIQVPSDARPGGHYAGVVFTPGSAVNTTNTGASVETKAGTLFYITVNGEIVEQSFISNFLANVFQEFGPVRLNIQIENKGDVHISPKGKVVVTDILGRKIENQTLAAYNVFPGAARDFDTMVGSQWMFGPFKASLTGTYGRADNLPLLATATFWVFPWRLAIIVILLIVAIILGVKYWNRRKNNRQATTPTSENTSTTPPPATP